MAWPPSDTFDDAHNTNVNTKADDAGNTWALVGGGTNPQVHNDAAQERMFFNTGGSSTGSYVENSATPPSADYEVGMTIRCLSDNDSSSLGVILRGTDNNNFYMVRYLTDASGGHNIQIRLNNASTQSNLNTFSVTALTAGETATLVARIIGNEIFVWWNGSLLGSGVDGSSVFTSALLSGFRHFGIASSTVGLACDFWYAATIAQTANPASDVSDGSWTDQSAGTSLFAAIDEAAASDADYIQSSTTTSGSDTEAKIRVEAVTDPGVNTNHIVRYRYSKDTGSGDTVNLRVRLYDSDGTTVIAVNQHNAISETWTDGSFTLTGGEADAITGYASGLVLGFLRN
jgi:hypothetical protein